MLTTRHPVIAVSSDVKTRLENLRKTMPWGGKESLSEVLSRLLNEGVTPWDKLPEIERVRMARNLVRQHERGQTKRVG